MNAVIAVDFDGTCVTHEYPKIGRDIGAVPVLKKLVNAGNALILCTMRGNLTKPNGDLYEAVQWFEDNGIPLYGVNTNPTQERWTKSPKPYADLYIDDAALGCPLVYPADYSRPYVDWGRVYYLLHTRGFIDA